MYKRIVVPLDGSDLAERALPQAEALARLAGAPLHLVCVVDLTRLERYGPYALAVPSSAFEQVLAEDDAQALEYLSTIERRLTARGLAATAEVRNGPVAPTLVSLAQPGDLIAMATHGRGGLGRWFLGSVAEAVVRRAPVPVLLIRAQDDAAASQDVPTEGATIAGLSVLQNRQRWHESGHEDGHHPAAHAHERLLQRTQVAVRWRPPPPLAASMPFGLANRDGGGDADAGRCGRGATP